MRDEIIFTMGLPAAGKSTTARAMFPSHTRIDPDEIKATLPGYTPERAADFHDESSAIAESKFAQAIATGRGQYVVDGTGTNSDGMVRRIRQAQAAGFFTRLVYVTCSLKTSLRRASKRARVVPEYVIREKALNIATSFEIVSGYVDEVSVIHND